MTPDQLAALGVAALGIIGAVVIAYRGIRRLVGYIEAPMATYADECPCACHNFDGSRADADQGDGGWGYDSPSTAELDSGERY